MFYSDDPAMDYARYCDEQEKQMAKLPLCERCGNRVTDDTYYDIHGEILCEECLKDRYRKWVDDYV